MGLEDSLPKTWEDFKSKLVDFCAESGLEAVEKYSNETWLQYLQRLKDFIVFKNISEEEVLRKLRHGYLPRSLQILVYSNGISLNTIIIRTMEMESFMSISRPKENYKNNFKTQGRSGKPYEPFKQKSEKKDVECFRCKLFGHYSNNCPQKNGSTNNIDRWRPDTLDVRAIKINDKTVDALFDTGASDSMITSAWLNYLNLYKTIPVNRTFNLIDGSRFEVNRTVKALFEYNGKLHSEEFNVVENTKDRKIILGNDCLKRILSRKEIPVQCHINTGDAGPISWNRPLRSLQDKKDLKKLTDELEKAGILEESTSMWLNPVVLVRKKAGKVRFCIDFRRLNDLVTQDNYEIPRITELMSQLRDQRYFTGIDLKDGFFQISVNPEDRSKTAFYTGSRLLQFKKMPQGFKNSPAVFQRSMDYVMKGLIGKGCIVYIDDILVYGKTRDEHDANLKQVLKRLETYGLNENKDKRVERVEEITFLGFRLSYNTTKPLTSRTQGIKEYREPKTRKELQRFIGLINYDRGFIKGITNYLKPLYKLLEKETSFTWGENERKVFNEIKDLFSENLELTIPEMNSTFTLETDASQFGLGACLLQENKPIAFISRSLSKAEQSYGITEREVLAAIWAMEKLSTF